MTTADQAKAKNIAKMGDVLGTQYSALWQEVAYLHMNWKEFVELFGTKAERIEIMNKAAPAFFRMVQDELFEVTLLSIARMTDPPQSMGKKNKANLTIRNFPELIGHANTKAKVEKLLKDVEKQTEFARVWRNKRIMESAN